jgi:2-polyprenyl-6-methoxyphenol hydroxylase-like FAD-dependent oxidoreductase
MAKPIIIAGGGIGGFTLALMLHRQGIPCQVFEAAKTGICAQTAGFSATANFPIYDIWEG